MLSKNTALKTLLLVILITGLSATAFAQESISVNTGVDLYNRYVWRGGDIANTPSIQPFLSVSYAGLELGTWGAYTLSNEQSDCDEIDFWLSYTRELESGVAFSAMITDYYYPNAGLKFSNFDGDGDSTLVMVIDDEAGTADSSYFYGGAHTLEIGLSITGPSSFPVTLSGYFNVHNDAGNNAYFQLDYPVMVNEYELGFFCGVTPGSEDNPGYYGADEFAFINLGVTASRDIQVSETLNLPLTVSFVINPESEMSHLLVGLSF